MLKRITALAAILALSIALTACGGSGDGGGAGETPRIESTPVSEESAEMVEHIRERTMRMWEVYNTHVPEALEEFYSEDYWEEEAEEVRQNMQPFKNLGLTFTAEETSPPTEISPGRWQIKQTARFQGGLVNMVFIYEEFDGDWLLTHAKPE